MPSFPDNILPLTAGQSLGSSTLPWNVFASQINVTNPTGLTVTGLNNSGNATIQGNLTVIGTTTHIGPLVAKTFDNVQIVDSTLSRGGVDICGEINLAYAALPASGGTIEYYPTSTGTPYSCTTPMVFTTPGKLINLINKGTCTISTGSVLGGGCINFTPTTAVTAITADYVANTNSTGSAAHGFSNIVIINNNCITTGGCSSSAIGLSNGNTNQGMLQGQCFNCGFIGFGTAYQDLNNKAVDLLFTNPQFQANTTVALLESPTGIYFNGGTINGNGVVFKGNSTTSTPELDYFGTQFFGNNGLIWDFTSTLGGPAQVQCHDCHLENSPAAGNAHYANGNLDLVLNGGLVENDITSGTSDWMFSISGHRFTSVGTTFACVNTCTQIVLLNTPARAFIHGHILSDGHFTNIVGGVNVANATVMISSGSTITTAIPYSFESTFKSPFAIGDAQFTPNSQSALHIQFNANNFNAIRMTDTVNSRASAIGPGTVNLNRWSLRDVTNSKELFGCDITGVGTCNFPQGLQVNGVPVGGSFTSVNVTPVTVNANVATDQNLMAATITAGTLNSVGKTLLVQGAGVYSTPAASTSTLTHKLKLCTVSGCGSGTVVTLATWTSAALGTLQATNNPYNFTANISTQTAGATASFEVHGNLTADISASASAAEAVYADNNTATVGTIDSTAQLFLQHTVAFSNASASNSDTDRQMITDTVD